MQFSKNTSTSRKGATLFLMIKVSLIMIVIFVTFIMVSKIDFPSPNTQIKKNISNEKLKIVK